MTGLRSQFCIAIKAREGAGARWARGAGDARTDCLLLAAPSALTNC